MNIWTPAFIGALVGLAGLVFLYALFVRKNAIGADFKGMDSSSGFMKYAAVIGKETAKVLPSNMIHFSSEQEGSVQSRLQRAGNPWNVTVMEYEILRIGTAVLGVVFGIIAYILFHDTVAQIPWFAWILFGGFIGWLLPDYRIRKIGDKRSFELMKGLPEALEIIVTEASVSGTVENSFRTLPSSLQAGDTRNEFAKVAGDLNANRPLEDALLDMAKRAPTPSVEAFVHVVVQSIIMQTDPIAALEQCAENLRMEYLNYVDKRIVKMDSQIYIALCSTTLISFILTVMMPPMQGLLQAFSSGF